MLLVLLRTMASLPSDRDKADKMPGGYVSGSFEKVVQDALTARFGRADRLIPAGETNLYLNRSAMQNVKTDTGKPVTDDDVYRVAKEALLSAPELHVARVYTREQLDNGIPGDFIARAAMNGYYPKRSGDITIVLEAKLRAGQSRHFTLFTVRLRPPRSRALFRARH